MREERRRPERKPAEGPAAPEERPAGRAIEDALARLEQIAAQLETGNLELEAALRLYREARELHAFCVARLSAAEQEARILTDEGTLRSGDLETNG